uniref:Uncharacterized protein n=1 Tax=Trichogramma kaykai TaxID=54128 RepID=A0ABD2VX97_9HYME
MHRRAHNDIIFKAAAELLCRGVHITIDFIITRDCGAAHAYKDYGASTRVWHTLMDRTALYSSYRKRPNAARIAIHTV